MKIRFFFILITIFAIFACERQHEQITDATSVPDISVDESADAFAKILAASMNNPEMLDFIKEMADERFDGDENFLIMDKIDDRSTKSSNTFYDMLSVVATKSESSCDMDYIIEAIKFNDPLLQIYVMNSELWDSGIEPLVVLLPENYDDERVCTLTGYRMNGDIFTFSSENEIEDAPVVVLSRNERAVVVGSSEADMLSTPIYSNDIYDYHLKGHLFTANEENEGLHTKSSVSNDKSVAVLMGDAFNNCFRNQYYQKTDFVVDVTIKSKKAWTAIESGWLGNPELRLYIVHGERSGDDMDICVKDRISSDDDFYISGNVFKNRNDIRTYPWNQRTMTWSLYEQGDAMVYAWNEEDNSPSTKSYKVEFDINWYSYGEKITKSEPITYSFEVGNEDNFAGYDVIEYTDGDYKFYTGQYLTYYINLENL
ncbi:MAG: hypothetical protein IJZ70_07755 [Bacteroidales bacterium]|nr:hypothetical protein [Bacteroidales bacterium]